MLNWPKRALAALELLFVPLQDVDVYVEDKYDEVFYSHLLGRISDSTSRVVRVFAKNGRDEVLEAARNHSNNGRRALYLIDGDFDFVLGASAPSTARVFRLPAYCVENLLVSEAPAVRLVVEEARVLEHEAKARLGFTDWVSIVQEPLIELFASFAAAREFDPMMRTVSMSVERFYTTAKPGGLPTLDAAKVQVARDQVLSDLEAVADPSLVRSRYTQILERIRLLPFPLDAVSGKTFILPLFDMHLRHCECNVVHRRTLRNRLALNCEPERLSELRSAIVAAQ